MFCLGKFQKVLNKPIISTDVADAKIELDGYGIVTKMDEEDFYYGCYISDNRL